MYCLGAVILHMRHVKLAADEAAIVVMAPTSMMQHEAVHF